MRSETSTAEINTLENASCALCGGRDSQPLFAKKDKFGISQEPFTVVCCRSCGLSFINPRPAPSEIGRFYPEFYQWKEIGEQPRGLAAIPAKLEKAYRYHQLQTEIKKMIQVISSEARDPAKTKKSEISPGYARRNDNLEAGTSSLKLLDVGCGTGDRLFLLKQKGFEVYGVETSDQSDHAARHFGLPVFKGVLEEAGYPDNFFDVITLYNVLEHVHEPRKLLAEIFRILKPGGRLVVEVPDRDCLQSKILKGKWAAVDVPRDLYYFNQKDLHALLRSSGFEVRTVDSVTDFWHPPTLVISLFPGLDPQLIWARDQKKKGGILSRVFWAFWTLLFAPVVYLEGLLGRGALMTFYAEKEMSLKNHIPLEGMFHAAH